MSGLFTTLRIARTGLDAAQAGVQLTGHNIANANTEGFHRRTLLTTPVVPPPSAQKVLGGGVWIEGVQRGSDPLLAKRVLLGTANEGYSDTQQAMMRQLDRIVGDSSDSGLQERITALFNSFSALATAPEDIGARENVRTAADQLAKTFNRKATEIGDIATGIDTEVETFVGQVNQLAQSISKLNTEIGHTEAAGADASDLHDQQDQMLKKISELTGATSFVDGKGATTVLLGGLTFVQGEHYAQLAAEPDAGLGGHFRVDFVDGLTSIDATNRLGGRIGALTDVRDQTLGGVLTNLDQLAYDIGTNVNTQHAAGFGLDGLDNRNLFNAPGAPTGAAVAMALNSTLTAQQIGAATDAAALPSDNRNALLLSGLRSGTFAGGGTQTAINNLNGMITQLSTQTEAAQTNASVSKDELTHLKGLQSSVEGVSLDEEMVKLIEYQRSYQASARVLQVVDGLLDDLMRI